MFDKITITPVEKNDITYGNRPHVAYFTTDPFKREEPTELLYIRLDYSAIEQSERLGTDSFFTDDQLKDVIRDKLRKFHGNKLTHIKYMVLDDGQIFKLDAMGNLVNYFLSGVMRVNTSIDFKGLSIRLIPDDDFYASQPKYPLSVKLTTSDRSINGLVGFAFETMAAGRHINQEELNDIAKDILEFFVRYNTDIQDVELAWTHPFDRHEKLFTFIDRFSPLLNV